MPRAAILAPDKAERRRPFSATGCTKSLLVRDPHLERERRVHGGGRTAPNTPGAPRGRSIRTELQHRGEVSARRFLQSVDLPLRPKMTGDRDRLAAADERPRHLLVDAKVLGDLDREHPRVTPGQKVRRLALIRLPGLD